MGYPELGNPGLGWVGSVWVGLGKNFAKTWVNLGKNFWGRRKISGNFVKFGKKTSQKLRLFTVLFELVIGENSSRENLVF